MSRMSIFLPVALWMAFTSGWETANAGVSPENVIVVVNGDSIDSRTVANHYVQVRDIPSSNVIVLRGVPGDGLNVELADFKSRILFPILKEIDRRGLAAQARVIAYSSNFPTSVKIGAHTDKLTDEKMKKHQKPVASINGLTFFYRMVLADQHQYLYWSSNLYARGPFARHFANPFGGETGKRFAKADVDLKEGRFEEAANEFEALLKVHPTLAPLGVRAAEAHVQAGDKAAAAKMLRTAIDAGWHSGTYLKDSKLLAPLLDDAAVGQVAAKLNGYPTIIQEPIGFVSDRGWTSNGYPLTKLSDGVPFLMSCMLGVVHARGSSVDQAVKVFKRSAEGDHQFPKAGFWFTLTKDIRTKTRFPLIGDAMVWLRKSDQECSIIHSAMPDREGDCVGLMLGTASMSFRDRKWNFVAGAISDNLTSLSGHFGTPAQSKLTDLLHAGAAMASGPVAEPYSIQAKFPLPFMYSYYASGVTAIEAFYLSVASPYQLLIVGDPLAQPFARPPLEWATAKVIREPNKRVRVTSRPMRFDAPHTRLKKIELFVDGKLVPGTPNLGTFEIKLPESQSGKINVRTVLVGDDATEPRSWFSDWVDLGGEHPAPTVALDTQGDERIKTGRVKLSAKGADTIELFHHTQSVGLVSGGAGTLRVDVKQLGRGPVRLRAVAKYDKMIVPGEATVIELQ